MNDAQDVASDTLRMAFPLVLFFYQLLQVQAYPSALSVPAARTGACAAGTERPMLGGPVLGRIVWWPRPPLLSALQVPHPWYASVVGAPGRYPHAEDKDGVLVSLLVPNPAAPDDPLCVAGMDSAGQGQAGLLWERLGGAGIWGVQ